MKRHWGKVSLLEMILFISLVVLILSTGNSPVYAQSISNNSKADLGWLNAGIGGSSFGFSKGVSFSYQTGKHLISTRYTYNGVYVFKAWEIGILYGRSLKTSLSLVSVSGGISIVGGIRRGKYLYTSFWCHRRIYEKITFLTIGIPIVFQLFWTPASFFGIGIYGLVNLNPEESFYGALLCIQLGKLR